MKFLLTLLTVLAFALPAWSDPSTRDVDKWVRDAGGSSCSSTINPGTTCFFYYTTGATTSQAINVGGSGAVLCGTPGGSAVIWTGVTDNTDANGFAVPQGTLDGTNCFTVAPGFFHLHVTPGAGTEAVRIEGF